MQFFVTEIGADCNEERHYGFVDVGCCCGEMTLGIGVLLSLFSSLTCTRTLLRVLMSYPALRRINYFIPLVQRSEGVA